MVLAAVLILLVAVGIYFLFKDDNKGMNAASSSGPSIEFHNSDVKETKDGKELYAENLTYDGNKEILSTDKAFIVKKDGKVLTADAFDADRVLQKITARGHAKLAEEEGAK